MIAQLVARVCVWINALLDVLDVLERAQMYVQDVPVAVQVLVLVVQVVQEDAEMDVLVAVVAVLVVVITVNGLALLVLAVLALVWEVVVLAARRAVCIKYKRSNLKNICI